MKTLKILLLTLGITSIAYAADNNCTDTGAYPTVGAQCSCIITNAVSECQAHLGAGSPFCVQSKLDSLFRTAPNLAEAQCERYRDPSHPDECSWSVTFYDQKC